MDLKVSSAHPDRRPAEEQVLTAPEKALAALSQKDFVRAADILREILRGDPDNAAGWYYLGATLREQGHRAAGLCCAKRAAALGPPEPTYLTNISDSLVSLDRMDEAVEVLSSVVQAAPKNVTYRRMYADALRQCKKFGEALVQIDIASAMQPDDVETNWQRAILHLSLGQLGAGWKYYEARWKRGNIKENAYSAPHWAGQDLTGKTILLYEEQGFGDTILASRYIPLVKQRGARVIFGCRPALHKLFKTVPGIDRFLEEGAIGEALDYHTSLLSLPGEIL